MQNPDIPDRSAVASGPVVANPDLSVYQLALRALRDAAIPHVVGGAFALGHYTGQWRHTADFDVFVLPRDVHPALDVLRKAGLRTWVADDAWLAKAARGSVVVDVIFGGGNHVTNVDDQWLARSQTAVLFGLPVQMIPIEELIWSKAYVASRERFDGADVVHLLLRAGGLIDWPHLVSRFGDHWMLLLAYLHLFQFVYPSERDVIPRDVMDDLAARQRRLSRRPPAEENVCRGPLLDRTSYVFDLSRGFVDPRRRDDAVEPESARPTRR